MDADNVTATIDGNKDSFKWTRWPTSPRIAQLQRDTETSQITVITCSCGYPQCMGLLCRHSAVTSATTIAKKAVMKHL